MIHGLTTEKWYALYKAKDNQLIIPVIGWREVDERGYTISAPKTVEPLVWNSVEREVTSAYLIQKINDSNVKFQMVFRDDVPSMAEEEDIWPLQ